MGDYQMLGKWKVRVGKADPWIWIYTFSGTDRAGTVTWDPGDGIKGRGTWLVNVTKGKGQMHIKWDSGAAEVWGPPIDATAMTGTCYMQGKPYPVKAEALASPTAEPKADETKEVVTFLDFVVRYRAGETRYAGANLDEAKVADYRKKPNRKLILISKLIEYPNRPFDSPVLIDEVVGEIERELKAPGVQQGIICINGNSAGARTALLLAQRLKGKRTIKFLGLADAYLTPDLPGLSDPVPDSSIDIRHGKAKDPPFWNTPLQFEADIMHNYFQHEDNYWTKGPTGLGKREWTGRDGDRNREIHGKIAGFDNGGGFEIKYPSKEKKSAHTYAGDQGDINNGARISKLLAEL
jgi:hypothetical protein